MFRNILCSAAAAALIAGSVDASHNRGSALVPSIDANGLLTVEATSFWRPTAPSGVNSVRIVGPGLNVVGLRITDVDDTSDSRYTRNDRTFTQQLSQAGLYTVSWSTCCRVGGTPNASFGNMGTTSTIYWDGQNATKPITFDIENIQPNVQRGVAYSDNLDVTSDNGDMLSYDDTVLTVGISSQAPGFSIDAAGQMSMTAAATNAIVDNGTTGADIAFSGEISANDGTRETGSVQFDWVFDATNMAANQPPTVTDVVINATVGDMINEVITAGDPDAGDLVTLTSLGMSGPGGGVSGFSFGTTPGNPASGTFAWDTGGFGPGTYIATFGATDGSLTDQGTLRINLSSAPVSAVPLPAGAVLLGSGMIALGWMRRRRKA